MEIKEGIKHDSNKLRYDLIPPEALEGLAQVYTFGANKYDDRNWEKGIKYSRVFAAIMRHLWAWFRGEDKDIESRLSHLDHASWGCFALRTYVGQEKQLLDDRPIFRGQHTKDWEVHRCTCNRCIPQ